MKLNTIFSKILPLLFITTVSCSTPAPAPAEFGIDSSTIELGTEQSGNFVQKKDKTFTADQKIILKVKARGLAIKQGKLKVNADIFLKKDKDILGTENDILGQDGLTQSVPGTDATYSGSNGEALIKIGIIPPSETTGEMAANVTLKDLNSSGKLISFETKFTIIGSDSATFNVGN
jgi:hypothetical protein